MAKSNPIRDGRIGFPFELSAPDGTGNVTIETVDDFAEWLFSTNRYALAKRLGCLDTFDDEVLNWSQIGVLLAKDTPEFKPSNEFGRPGRPQQDRTIDEERLRLVNDYKEENGGTDFEAIRSLMESGRIAKSTLPESVAQGVSRARARLAKKD